MCYNLCSIVVPPRVTVDYDHPYLNKHDMANLKIRLRFSSINRKYGFQLNDVIANVGVVVILVMWVGTFSLLSVESKLNLLNATYLFFSTLSQNSIVTS